MTMQRYIKWYGWREDILEYFREADSDTVEDALDALGVNDYEEEEVRLMRIKFISEVGN